VWASTRVDVRAIVRSCVCALVFAVCTRVCVCVFVRGCVHARILICMCVSTSTVHRFRVHRTSEWQPEDRAVCDDLSRFRHLVRSVCQHQPLSPCQQSTVGFDWPYCSETVAGMRGIVLYVLKIHTPLIHAYVHPYIRPPHTPLPLPPPPQTQTVSVSVVSLSLLLSGADHHVCGQRRGVPPFCVH